jgi:hypothetical protein
MKPIAESKKTTTLPEHGTLVKIKSKRLPPEKCGGFFVKQKHIDARIPKENGEYVGWVAGGGGDLWWVKHDDGLIGCYLHTEVIDR